MPNGYWEAAWSRNPPQYRLLRHGERYRVVKAFRDFDGDEHPVDESWTFLGYNFSAYDDGLSLFVSLDGTGEWHIRMLCMPDAQGPIVDNLQDYVAMVGGG